MELNRLLLRLRKSGQFNIQATRRVNIRNNHFEKFIFASEIAARVFSDKGFSLDDVLSDPALADEFDRTAASYAPGFQPFDYRWGALKIRKTYHELSGAIDELDEALQRRKGSRPAPLTRLDFQRIPAVPGIYRICGSQGTVLYVGGTIDLRQRIRSQLGDESVAAYERFCDGLHLSMLTDIDQVNQRNGLQGHLLAKYRPRLNFYVDDCPLVA